VLPIFINFVVLKVSQKNNFKNSKKKAIFLEFKIRKKISKKFQKKHLLTTVQKICHKRKKENDITKHK
jgi:hypothetical protein